MRGIGNDEGGTRQCFDHDRKRVLHATGPEGSTRNDDESRQLKNGAEMPAFQRLTADDRPNGDDNAEYCGDIHGLVTSMPWAVGVPQKYLYQVGMVGLRPSK